MLLSPSNSRPKNRAFTLGQATTALATLSILGAILFFPFGSDPASTEVRGTSDDPELERIDRAIEAYLADGGSLADENRSREILHRLRASEVPPVSSSQGRQPEPTFGYSPFEVAHLDVNNFFLPEGLVDRFEANRRAR